MNLDHVFKKPNQHRRILNARKPEVPEGMLCRCNKCGKAIFAEEVRNGDYICPKCQGYFRLNAQERIRRIADEGTFEEGDADLVGENPLGFEGYEEKLDSLCDDSAGSGILSHIFLCAHLRYPAGI